MEIAVVGAGSHFTLALLRGLYQQAQHDDYHLRLMDVRPAPLAALAALIPRLNAATGRRFTATYTTDRERALDGADHVLVAFAVDFPDAFLRTCWVLHNHGIQFVEGETATPGALLATLRHLPPLLTLADELQARAPQAWLHVINNPMPRLVLGVLQGTGCRRVVGHCHGTIHVRDQIAALTEVPSSEIDLFVAGINHFHLVQRAVDRRSGADLLGALRELPANRVREWQAHDYTQWKMFGELGYLFGHGIWHNFDYLPYANHRLFRHTERNTWERACLAVQARRRGGLAGEIGAWLTDDAALTAFLAEPEPEQIIPIMQALAGEREPYFYLSGNLPNAGHIPQLPAGAIVELPALVRQDKIELQPALAPLPRFVEAWLRTQLAIHELSVRAVLERRRRPAVEAIACDPSLRDCDCGPGELLDDLLAANQGIVPALT